ncbi:hypothetical protein KM043_004838 [Ampulex compressa]|nr:hypothetical protein KM043_004838 [Ampulex compressa]
MSATYRHKGKSIGISAPVPDSEDAREPFDESLGQRARSEDRGAATELAGGRALPPRRDGLSFASTLAPRPLRARPPMDLARKPVRRGASLPSPSGTRRVVASRRPGDTPGKTRNFLLASSFAGTSRAGRRDEALPRRDRIVRFYGKVGR